MKLKYSRVSDSNQLLSKIPWNSEKSGTDFDFPKAKGRKQKLCEKKKNKISNSLVRKIEPFLFSSLYEVDRDWKILFCMRGGN